jgi:hypothetical protein
MPPISPSSLQKEAAPFELAWNGLISKLRDGEETQNAILQDIRVE